MATTPQKFPPPPYLVGTDQNTQMLNRWLLEVQNVLSAGGGIDPSSIAGYTELLAQVATNTTNITALEGSSGSQGAAITTLQGEVVVNTAAIATINGQITSLSARNQVFNGTVAPVTLHANGDYYVDTTAKHLYVQVAGTWTLIV